MKKFYYLLLMILGLGIFSCDVMDPLKDDLDALSDDIDEEITYELTASDYSTLADRVLYLDSTDATNAAFINSNQYFTDEITSTEYLPMVLDVLYPGLSGATADITFNYYGDAPAALTSLAECDSYTLTSDDFATIDETVGYLNYFPSLYENNIEQYIAKFLKLNYKYEGSNDTVIAKYYYSDNDVKIDFTKKINTCFYEYFNDGDLGLFTTYSVSGDQKWEYISTDNGAAYISGYDNDYITNEDWLVSPTIDLSDVTNTYLQFKHNVSHYANGCIALMVTKNVDKDFAECQWSEYSVSDPSTGIDVYKESDLFNLTAYDGQKIKIAFKYSSTTSDAPDWSISEVEIGNYGYQVIGGGDTYLVQDVYVFDSAKVEWSKSKDIYRLNEKDYEAMGLDDATFSSSVSSQDYLPAYADILFPNAKTEDVKYIIFDYDNSSNITLADALTKTDSSWQSSYAYIQYKTEPYRCVDGTWKFDPSVILTMTTDDYQIVVDYVNSVPEYKEISNSSYDNSEYYFGASAYYGNFDIRSGSYYSGFETWQEAVTTALLEGLLPNKYPDATQYVSGVEVYYYITFQGYSGARTYYTCTFSVSKDTPNPEFELTEGPTEQ